MCSIVIIKNGNVVMTRKIRAAALAAIEHTGFTIRENHSPVLQISESVDVWVGLNITKKGNGVITLCNVGIHCRKIESLICDMTVGNYARQYDSTIATYATPLASLELPPTERSFFVETGASDEFIAEEAARLARLVSDYGIPYAQEVSDYTVLLEKLKPLAYKLGGFPERYAACLYFLKRYNELDEFITKYPEQLNPYVAGFFEPLMRKVHGNSA